MIIKATHNGEVKELEVNYNIASDVLDLYVDKEIDIDWNVELSEVYISNDDTIPHNLNDIVRLLNDISTTIVSITKDSMYKFKVLVSGKPGEVIGIFNILDINHIYYRLSTAMSTDLIMIDNVISDTHNSFDYNHSLVIKYLSDRNGNVSYRIVYETLLSHGHTDEISALLVSIFKKMYGMDIKDAKLPVNGDKMSLNNIDNKSLDILKSKVMNRIIGDSHGTR